MNKIVNINRGGSGCQYAVSAEVYEIKMTELINMPADEKPLVVINSGVYYHISDTLFCLNGLRYGDSEDHYISFSGEYILAASNLWCDIQNIIPYKNTTVYNRWITYIMFDPSTGLYKIGRSGMVRTRLSKLSSKHPGITLIATVNLNIERDLHIKYSEFRRHGEWFNLSESVVESIIIENNFVKIKHPSDGRV